MLKTLWHEYRNAANFDKIFPDLEVLFSNDYEFLVDLNIDLIYFVCKLFDIKVKFQLESNLSVKGEKTVRLAEICKKVKCNYYLVGSNHQLYADDYDFARRNIHIVKTDFIHPTYHQLHGEFIKNLSIIDLIFNYDGKFESLFR